MTHYILFLIFLLTAQTIRTIQLITPQPDEWREFKELRLSALKELPEAFGVTVEEEINKSKDDWQACIHSAIAQETCWLICAKEDNEFVGMIYAEREAGECFKHLVWIKKVYVKPAWRKHSVGIHMLDAMTELLTRDPWAEQLALWVTCDMTNAIKLYHKAGFTIAGRLEKAISINDTFYDNYLMQKTLIK
jgi:ribosomal protein S18 acetylase RimI-like enzyme